MIIEEREIVFWGKKISYLSFIWVSNVYYIWDNLIFLFDLKVYANPECKF